MQTPGFSHGYFSEKVIADCDHMGHMGWEIFPGTVMGFDGKIIDLFVGVMGAVPIVSRYNFGGGQWE